MSIKSFTLSTNMPQVCKTSLTRLFIILFFCCSKLINVAVPGTIDERAINMKRMLNPWERNENHTLCLNSAKAIGCTLVNIGTQDFIEGRVCIPFTFSNLFYNGFVLLGHNSATT